MSTQSHLRLRRNILSGLFVVIPLWVTFIAVSFIIDILVATGRPFVLTFARNVRSDYAILADLLAEGWFQSTLALIVVFAALYVIGAAANAAPSSSGRESAPSSAVETWLRKPENSSRPMPE